MHKPGPDRPLRNDFQARTGLARVETSEFSGSSGVALSIYCRYTVGVDERFMPVDGEALRRVRRERALSLRELGELSGVAFDAINKLELGKRAAQPRTIRKLAVALGVEPRELMKGD